MAVAFDTASGSYDGGSVASITLNKTSSGSNRIAVIAYMPGGNVGDTSSGVTVGGNAATLVDKRAVNASQYVYLYYYINPPTASTAYVASSSVNTDMGIAVATYTGAKQSGQPDASVSSGATGNLTLTVTTVADNSWLVGAARNTGTGPMVVGTGTTSRDATNLLFTLADSNGAKTPAGSYSLEFTAAAGNSGGVMMSIAPAVDAAAVDALMFGHFA